MSIENENEEGAAGAGANNEGNNGGGEGNENFDSLKFLTNEEGEGEGANNSEDNSGGKGGGNSGGDGGEGANNSGGNSEEEDEGFFWDENEEGDGAGAGDNNGGGDGGEGDASEEEKKKAAALAEAAKNQPKKITEILESAGIKVKDDEEAVEAVKKLINENIEIKTSSISNKAIDFYKKTLSLKDEELVRKVLESDGLTGDLLEKAIKKHKSDGTIDVEAEMIRSRVRKRIDEEVQKESQKVKNEEAMRLQRQAESRKLLKDHLDKTETMFGFKMVKDAKDLPKVREGMVKYIESGKFMDELLKDAESIADAAWFQRNKKSIIKALQNKGIQAGKKEILENMGNHTKDESGRIINPDPEKTDFNPSKFVTGN
jgi:hypothetical protein